MIHPRAYVVVEGGVVQAVFTDDEVVVTVVDHDDGDADGTPAIGVWMPGQQGQPITAMAEDIRELCEEVMKDD